MWYRCTQKTFILIHSVFIQLLLSELLYEQFSPQLEIDKQATGCHGGSRRQMNSTQCKSCSWDPHTKTDQKFAAMIGGLPDDSGTRYDKKLNWCYKCVLHGSQSGSRHLLTHQSNCLIKISCLSCFVMLCYIKMYGVWLVLPKKLSGLCRKRRFLDVLVRRIWIFLLGFPMCKHLSDVNKLCAKTFI